MAVKGNKPSSEIDTILNSLKKELAVEGRMKNKVALLKFIKHDEVS